MSLKLSATLPSGAAAPASSTISSRSNVQSVGGSDLTVLAVIALSVTSAVTLQETPAFSFTLDKAPTGTPYIAYYDMNNASAGWNVLLGPGTVSGKTIAFSAEQIVPPLTFQPNDTYLFALLTSASTATSTSATYTGTKTTNFTYGYDFGYPTPAPGATEAPTTLSYTVSTTVGTGSATYPGSTEPSGAVDQKVAESDVSSLSTSTYSTDSWVTLNTSSAPYTASLNATLQQEPSSADLPQIATVWTTPQTIDEYAATGSPTWTNSPAGTISYSYANSDNGTHVIASDGSYTDTENLLDQGAGGQVVLTENSDGSGSITGPYFSGDFISSVQFSASQSTTCNPVNITASPVSPPCLTSAVNYTVDAQNYYGYPPDTVIPDATWYSLPLKLYTETDGITPGVSLPAGCTPNSFGSSADDVNRTMTTTDTVNGVVETTVLDSYEVNGTPICLTSTDTQNYAYDQQGNVPAFLLVGQLGLEVITTNETLILSSGLDAASSAARHVTSSSGKTYALSSVTAAMQGHQLTTLARDRAVQLRTFLKTIASSKTKPLMVEQLHGGSR
ncbi:MAG TPA: hypothetical protein VMD07_06945 [Candidatus Acidoferrales bacterium]|nr:hypothetical protein [Candidatus Acidoferrales bacterium]